MIRKISLAVLLAAAFAAPASAEPATLLGVFQNWSAYSAGNGNDMTCYALSAPKASQPRGAKRGSIYLMVSDWPGRKVKAEPQVVLGYPVKENAPAAVGMPDSTPEVDSESPAGSAEPGASVQVYGCAPPVAASVTGP